MYWAEVREIPWTSCEYIRGLAEINRHILMGEPFFDFIFFPLLCLLLAFVLFFLYVNSIQLLYNYYPATVMSGEIQEIHVSSTYNSWHNCVSRGKFFLGFYSALTFCKKCMCCKNVVWSFSRQTKPNRRLCENSEEKSNTTLMMATPLHHSPSLVLSLYKGKIWENVWFQC